jgi:hypothetical protein
MPGSSSWVFAPSMRLGLVSGLPAPLYGSGLRHINLRNVRGTIAKISLILDGAGAQLDHYTSCMDDYAPDCY